MFFLIVYNLFIMRYLLPIITLQLDFINTLIFGESYLIYSRSDIYGRWTKNRVKADDPWELTVKLDSRKDLKWTVHEIGRPWNKKLNVPRDRNWTIFQTRRSRGMNSHLEHLWVYLVGHLGKKLDFQNLV